jgi:GntR family transcriptional regulator/GntR family frlABCD operon transcriptional regulator
MSDPIYRQIQSFLKTQIQQGVYGVGNYLPSENELCSTYQITRTTARKALEELLKEGFIERQHGKGSRVRERRQSLGLLNVKGFSEAVGQNVTTIFLEQPKLADWNIVFPFRPTERETDSQCIYFERLRCVDNEPVMLEQNWFSGGRTPNFIGNDFVQNSFFKTLSQRYFLEITGSEQEIRALSADEKVARVLAIQLGSPILQISIRFSSSDANFHVYSQLYCNTEKYAIGNSYFL